MPAVFMIIIIIMYITCAVYTIQCIPLQVCRVFDRHHLTEYRRNHCQYRLILEPHLALKLRMY